MSTLLFSSSVKNSRCPSRSGVKWSKPPSFNPGSGMVATCLSGSLLCAKDKSGINAVRVHTAKNLRFMKLSPFDCGGGNMIGRDKRHAMLRYGSRTRQRQQLRKRCLTSVSTAILRHLKGFAPASVEAAKHKLIFL